MRARSPGRVITNESVARPFTLQLQRGSILEVQFERYTFDLRFLFVRYTCVVTSVDVAEDSRDSCQRLILRHSLFFVLNYNVYRGSFGRIGQKLMRV